MTKKINCSQPKPNKINHTWWDAIFHCGETWALFHSLRLIASSIQSVYKLRLIVTLYETGPWFQEICVQTGALVQASISEIPQKTLIPMMYRGGGGGVKKGIVDFIIKSSDELTDHGCECNIKLISGQICRVNSAIAKCRAPTSGMLSGSWCWRFILWNWWLARHRRRQQGCSLVLSTVTALIQMYAKHDRNEGIMIMMRNCEDDKFGLDSDDGDSHDNR